METSNFPKTLKRSSDLSETQRLVQHDPSRFVQLDRIGSMTGVRRIDADTLTQSGLVDRVIALGIRGHHPRSLDPWIPGSLDPWIPRSLDPSIRSTRKIEVFNTIG